MKLLILLKSLLFIFYFGVDNNTKKKNINKFLTKSQINEHQNKNIYVDVWASWCGPCVANLKFLNRLPDSSFFQKTTIIAINIDESTEKWNEFSSKYIVNKNIISIQLQKDDIKKFLEEMEIKSIPRYMLFDNAGNIVSEDMPGPSNPLLREILIKKNER